MGDDAMMFATVSTGVKGGGFDGRFLRATDDDQFFEYDEEEAINYELGIKSTLLDGAMTLNWAAFYTEYSDLQTAIFKGVGFNVKNAAESEVQGIELDLMWQATENLLIGGNAAWLDAEYKSFKDGPCTAIQLDVDSACGTDLGTTRNDLSGEPTLYASDYSAALFFNYERDFGSNMTWFFGADVNYRDDFNSAGDNDPIDVMPSYTKVNARIGVRGEQWEVMAYGRNIFDEEAFAQGFDTPVLAGSHTQFMEEGEIWGAKFLFRF